MTSYYARHRRLSQQTLRAYPRMDRSIADRLRFYVSYFEDVAPDEVTVDHVPSTTNDGKEEVQLRTPSGRIFMSGLVSMDRSVNPAEEDDADGAYTNYRNGYFVHYEGAWRFFTALGQLRVYCSFARDDWELMGKLPPFDDAKEVAAWLQSQYDSLRNY